MAAVTGFLGLSDSDSPGLPPDSPGLPPGAIRGGPLRGLSNLRRGAGVLHHSGTHLCGAGVTDWEYLQRLNTSQIRYMK